MNILNFINPFFRLKILLKKKIEEENKKKDDIENVESSFGDQKHHKEMFENAEGSPLHFDEQVRLKEALKELDEIDDEISKIHAKRASALFDTTTYFKVLTNTEVSAKTKNEVIKTIVEFYGDPSLVIDCKDNGEPYSVSPEGKEIPMGLDPVLEEQIKEIILKDGE